MSLFKKKDKKRDKEVEKLEDKLVDNMKMAIKEHDRLVVALTVKLEQRQKGDG